jgi:hypothetical protein
MKTHYWVFEDFFIHLLPLADAPNTTTAEIE